MKSTTPKVAMIAAGITKWGARQATFRDLASEAGKAAFDSNPNLSPADVDGLVASSVYPERSAYQGKVAPLLAETLGIRPRMFERVENQCGSGTAAIRTAAWAIMAGAADVVAVVGVEKMLLPNRNEVFTNALAGLDRDWEGALGVTPPGAFALVAQAHMDKYGTTEEQLAMVSVKNHAHSMNNPYAHFQKGPDLETVMASRPIASPFKLFDCAPNTDGAAVVVLASADRARDLSDAPVWMLGSGQGFDAYTMANMSRDWSYWPAVEQAGTNAYQAAGLTAADVDVVETHDCFTISEILHYEALGFCEVGGGGEFVAGGGSDYGGKVVVNPRGGLLACGHPIGATGVAQAHEMFVQLRGEAGARQVDDAHVGLSLTMSNIGSEAHCAIWGTDEVAA